MSDTLTLEALAGEIRQRLDATHSDMNNRLTEFSGRLPGEDTLALFRSGEALKQAIRENLSQILAEPDNDFARKVRWGGQRDEKLLGSKYARYGLTVSDVEMLHDITQAAASRGMGKGPSEELRNTFTAVSEGRYEETAVVRSRGHAQLTEMLRSGAFTPRQYERAVRAMDTAESGFGQQLIGAQYVNDLWRGAQAKARVFGLVNSFEMSAPTAYLPVQATLPVVKYVGESTVANTAAYNSTKTGSNRVIVDAKKLLMLQIWSYEMDEDSLIPFLPFLRMEAERSWAHHMDSIVLNGDNTNAATGNINLTDADPADDAYYLAFDGIRHACLVDNTNNQANIGGALTITNFRSQKGRMLDATYKHDWSHPEEEDDLVYVADPETADVISFFDECLTVQNIGERATVLTGQQGRLLNHPVIASIDVSKTNSSGVVSTTAGNNTKGQVVTFNRRGYVVGTRSQLAVETERDIRTQQNVLCWSTRVGFGRFSPTGASSGIESADVLFNISL